VIDKIVVQLVIENEIHSYQIQSTKINALKILFYFMFIDDQQQQQQKKTIQTHPRKKKKSSLTINILKMNNDSNLKNNH
jgi:hypothetical protein